MNKLLFLLLCFIQPVIVFSQTTADYEHTISEFMKFYNKNDVKSLRDMYSPKDWGKLRNTLWTPEEIKELKEKYGDMKSYKFIELYKPANGDGGGDGLAFFKTVFTKSTHMMAVTLNKQNEIVTFRFETSSHHIDSLLKRN